MRLHISLERGHSRDFHDEVFDKGTVTIGRDREADVRMHPQQDVVVARGVHARLERHGTRWELIVEHDNGVTLTDPDGGNDRTLGAGERARIDRPTLMMLGRNGPQLLLSPESDLMHSAFATQQEMEPPPARPTARVLHGHHRETSRRIRGWSISVVGVALLLVIAAVLLWQRSWSTQKSVATVQQSIDSLRDEAQQRLEIVNRRIDETARDALGETLRAAQQSVMIVGLADQAGYFLPIGTAWVIAEHHLATNAHVVEALQAQHDQLHANFGQELHITARLPGDPYRDFRVAEMVAHPGFERWGKAATAAQRLIVEGQLFTDVRFVPLCDVGLLRTDETLPPALPLATPEQWMALRSGSEIGTLGFPTENIQGSFVNAPPTTQVGRVAALTDSIGNQAKGEAAVILQHAMFSTGGASGSPILSADGQVVAIINSGSVASDPETNPLMRNRRWRVPVGLNFALSVAFLRDMLEGTVDDGLADDTQRWLAERDRAGITPPPP